ncbi:MAG: hypothetical protein ACN0LA_13985 [Candidatus Longimicrobiales bacterium M2_2A_002]
MLPLPTTALGAQSPLATSRVEPVGGPAVRVHSQATPLVAIRLSAPVPTGLPEGAVELLQELARPAAEATARRFGARLELRHEDGRAVIAVSGPAAAFDALVLLLRRATGEPDLSRVAVSRARARAEDRVLARLEQPEPRVRRLLQHGLYGGPAPRGFAAGQLTPETIRRLRGRLYDPTRLGVVVVGPIPTAVLRSAFADWPAGDPGAELPAPDSAAVSARPQAHREWGGIAFPVEADPAVLAVTAELVHGRLERSALRHGTVEAWYEPTPALVLVGAVTPGDSAVRAAAGITDLAVRDSSELETDDVHRYLRRLVAEAAALTGPDAVAAARSAVRHRFLLEVRTALGKAEAIGRLGGRAGGGRRAGESGAGAGVALPIDPEAYLRRVAVVDVAAVRSLLDRVLGTPAIVAEAR